MDFIILKIKELQKKKKISTKELSELINVTTQTIYDYFSAKSQISIKNLRKIAKALDVPVSYFFEETGGDVPVASAKNSTDNQLLLQKIQFLEKENKLLTEINTLLKKKS